MYAVYCDIIFDVLILALFIFAQEQNKSLAN